MQTGVAEEDDVLDSEQETEAEDLPQGEEEAEGSEASEGAEETSDDAGGEEEETVVSIGSEEPPTSEASEGDSSVMAELRRRYRETSRELQRLKAQQAGGQPQVTEAPKLRTKPTLEAHEFDAEKYEADLDKWHAEKVEAEAADREARRLAAEQAAAQQKAAQAVQERYAASKAALKVKGYDQIEEEVAAHFDMVQQSIVLKTQNPAHVVAALGTNPKKLSELAAIKDPVEFAFAIADLRREIKVTTRKATNKPAPEKTVGGGSAGGSNSQATLERLEAEAAKTGDRSKVIAYKRQLKATGKK